MTTCLLWGEYHVSQDISSRRSHELITWHRFEKRIDALDEAFRTLSDVVLIEFDEIKANQTFQLEKIHARFQAQERLIAVMENQCNRIESKTQQFQLIVEKKLDTLQTQVTRVSVALIEHEAERTRLNSNVDQIMNRDSEQTRKHHALQANQDQMGDWLQKLKEDSIQIHGVVFTMKTDHSAMLESLTNDSVALAKELGTLRMQIKAQTADCLTQLNNFTDALEQQRKLDRDLVEKDLISIRDAIQSAECTTRTSIDSLLKNSSRVRSTVDESMAYCTSDIKVLREEIRTTNDHVRCKLQSYDSQTSHMQSKVNHLLHAVQSLASILHLTTPLLG